MRPAPPAHNADGFGPQGPQESGRWNDWMHTKELTALKFKSIFGGTWPFYLF